MQSTSERALVPDRSEAARRGWVARRKRGGQAGNRNAAKSYAYSELAIRGEVARRVDYYLTVATYLDPMVDGPALAVAARLGVQAQHAHAAIEAAEAKGETVSESLRKHCAYLLQAELRALAACSLTPQARADLGLTVLDAEARARRASERALDEYRSPKEDSEP